MFSKSAIVLLVTCLIAACAGLFLLPVCPVQYKIEQETLKSGRIIYPVYARKLPFLQWKEVYSNPPTIADAKHSIQNQVHWYWLFYYDPIAKRFLPPDSLPLPRVSY